LGRSPNRKTFYLADSQERVVLQYAYDPESSTLDTHRTSLIVQDMPSGLLDGSAVDTRGHLWITEFAGLAFHELAPNGTLEQSISLPAPQRNGSPRRKV